MLVVGSKCSEVSMAGNNMNKKVLKSLPVAKSNIKRGYSPERVATKRSSKLSAVKKEDAKKEEAKKITLSSKEKQKIKYEALIIDHRENGRKLARSILRRWRVHMPIEEVDSIVDLGLCEAAQRFSPKKGASFMTFYFYHLRGHLVRAVARAAQFTNFQATVEGTQTEEEHNPEQFAYIMNQIDGEFNSSKDQETPEEIIMRREEIVACRTALDDLDSLEKTVLERSYASDEALVDIAKSLGYSRCHISRVKKAAMIKLKSSLKKSVHFSDKTITAEVYEEKIRFVKNREERTVRRKLSSIVKTTDKARYNKRLAA